VAEFSFVWMFGDPLEVRKCFRLRQSSCWIHSLQAKLSPSS